MHLKEILQKHAKYRVPKSLCDNLGDAYLMKTNPLFRSIRLAAIELGFRFTNKRFAHYDVLPLTQLPRILTEKKIPYSDNVTCLKEIEKNARGVFCWDEVPPLKANYIFHESAHGVAHALKAIYLKKSKTPKLPKNDAKVLQAMMEEAFSNSVECLANIYTSDEASREFFAKNAYIIEKSPAQKILRDLVTLIGIDASFRLLFLAFLHANFLKTKWNQIDFERVLKIVFQDEVEAFSNLKSSHRSLLKRAFQVGLDLDPTFTIFTNSFCFRLMGLKENIYALVEFDFLAPLEVQGAYGDWFSVLTAVISV